MKNIQKHLKNERGVTLVEMLAVIVIIGIVAAVAVPAVVNQISNSKVQADELNVRVLNEAVERYAIKEGAYPTVTGADATARATDAISDLKGGTYGPYIKADFPALPQQKGMTWQYDNATHVFSCQ